MCALDQDSLSLARNCLTKDPVRDYTALNNKQLKALYNLHAYYSQRHNSVGKI